MQGYGIVFQLLYTFLLCFSMSLEQMSPCLVVQQVCVRGIVPGKWSVVLVGVDEHLHLCQ